LRHAFAQANRAGIRGAGGFILREMFVRDVIAVVIFVIARFNAHRVDRRIGVIAIASALDRAGWRFTVQRAFAVAILVPRAKRAFAGIAASLSAIRGRRIRGHAIAVRIAFRRRSGFGHHCCIVPTSIDHHWIAGRGVERG
jgi:hypothetical protein